jgi:NADH dehydrogenase
MRVIVAGGGYAGLATLISLRHSLPEVEIHLIEPRARHIKLTHLHQTLRRPLSDFCIPFAALAQKYELTHHRFALPISDDNLEAWEWNRAIPLPEGELAFDYLVIATGAVSRRAPAGKQVYSQEDFYRREGQEMIHDFLAHTENKERHISVVGAGATGLQFLFELAELLKDHRADCQLRLIQRGGQILSKLPGAFHDYIARRLQSAGIEHLPYTRYRGQHGGTIKLENTRNGESFTLPSDLTLLFAGVYPHPQPLRADRYGRLIVGHYPLPHIFTAGDCSNFDGNGLNSLTAQAAVRKGKQVATNIKRLQQGRLPYIYTYDELGYFVSLGPLDGIGWMLFRYNIITGLPAFAIKEAIEAQYDLFIDGVDLYF